MVSKLVSNPAVWDHYPEGASMIFFSMFGIVNFLKTNASFYFRGLGCSGCRRLFDGGLGEKFLFRAG